MELVTQHEQVAGTSRAGTQFPVSLDFHVVANNSIEVIGASSGA